MYKQNMIYIYDEILFSLKKEVNSDTHYNMDEPWGLWYVKKSAQLQKSVISLIWGTEIHRDRK